MADLASVVDAQDVEDGLPLKSLRTVHKAQKIVDEKRKEEEALAAEPSLGFNDEWCKAHQGKVASSFKIQDLYGHMMPPQGGQPPIPVLTQFLSIVSNNDVFTMVKATKGARKEAKDADTWAKALTMINATIIKNICVVRRQGSKRTKEFLVARPIATSQNGQDSTCLLGTDEYLKYPGGTGTRVPARYRVIGTRYGRVNDTAVCTAVIGLKGE